MFNTTASLFDFNSEWPFWGYPPTQEALPHEYRPQRFRPGHVLVPNISLSAKRIALPWQSSHANIFLLRSISLYGLCTADLSRWLARYRNLFAHVRPETLSRRMPRNRFTQHIGRGQRTSRLAHLFRLGSGPDCQSSPLIRQGRFRRGTQEHGLRFRFDHDRSVHVHFPLGAFPQTQSRRQTSHPDRFARVDPLLHPNYRRKSPRCQYVGRSPHRSRSLLSDRPRLHRFPTPLHAGQALGFLRDSRQAQYGFPRFGIQTGRQNHGSAFRPIHSADRPTRVQGLSRRVAPHWLHRSHHAQALDFSHQQFRSSCTDDPKTLQVPLASRTLFQMDQAIPAHQSVLRHQRERGQDTNLDRHLGLRLDCDHQKRTRALAELGRNSASFEHLAFRENRAFSTVFRIRIHGSAGRITKPTELQRYLTGQQWVD